MAEEKRMLLDYPELYSDENINYFGELKSFPENLDELRKLDKMLEPVCAIVFRVLRSQIMTYNYIAWGLNQKRADQNVKSWWAIDTDSLNANETLFLISYPFFERWGGSWEVRFACSGELGRYLSIYKDKIEKEKSE